MRYAKLVGALGVLVVLAFLVGSLSTLTQGLFGLGGMPTDAGPIAMIATVVLVIAAVVGLTVAGARDREWLANPYW